MKKPVALLLAMLMMLSLCACGGREEAPAETPVPSEMTVGPAEETASPTEGSAPEVTEAPKQEELIIELPEVTDESLNAVLDCVTYNVRPGSAGCSLRAVQCAAALLDWAMGTSLSDDEICAAAGSYVESLDSEALGFYLESILSVYDQVYTLRDSDDAPELLEEAGAVESGYPWNEKAFRAVEMVSYATGAR